MNNMTAHTTVQVKTRKQARTGDQARARVEVSRGAITMMGVAPTLVGIWAMACFVGAMAANGGPVAMAGNWFRAITGM